MKPVGIWHGGCGAQLQQTLLAKAFVRRGFPVSMLVWDYGQVGWRLLEQHQDLQGPILAPYLARVGRVTMGLRQTAALA